MVVDLVLKAANGTKRTCGDVCYLSAFRDKADISQRLSNNRDLSVPALEILFGEFAKLVGDGTGESQAPTHIRPPPIRSDRGSCQRRDRPIQRAIPLLVPGRRFSSSSPSGSSSCTSQWLSRCDTEIASSEMVLSSG